MGQSLNAQIPEAFAFLFEPARYKVVHGGRGGAKSHSLAKASLIEGVNKPLRFMCARELQVSIKDSVHKLLGDQISALGMNYLYEVQQAVIRGTNGTEFSFVGLRHNVAGIKSFEGADRCWVEEAQTVSKASWDVLIPTIRKPGSEIWISFNAELDTDETYKRFVANPPPGAVVRKINYYDNPFFPQVLRDEMEHLKVTDPDAYQTVWLGNCRLTLDGAIYAKELRQAMDEGRICSVPYDASKPVQTFWDLGYADNTSIWFAQTVGFETRIVDFYQSSQQPLTHYLQVLQNRGYVLGTCWLPHDARAKTLGTGKSVEEMMRAAGRTVQIVPQISVADGISATRTLFSNFWFDEKKCADGLQALRRYRYDVDENGQFSRTPLHDDASHASDSLRYLAIGLREPSNRNSAKPKLRLAPAGRGAWMG